MDEPVFFKFDEITTREIAPGFFSKLIHTEANTINFIQVKAGSAIQSHHHPHQQSSFVIDGEFELTVNDNTEILSSGTFAIIPPDAWHSGRAITDCSIIDIFNPPREDYKLL